MFCLLDKDNIKVDMIKKEIKEVKLKNDELHFYYKDGEHKWFEFYDNKEAEESFYDILKQLNKEDKR